MVVPPSNNLSSSVTSFDGGQFADDVLSRGFELISFIGRGSYGLVALARRVTVLPGEEPLVAIKQCLDVFSSLLMAKRHLRELRVLRRMRHSERSVTVLDAFASQRRECDIYIVMERMPCDVGAILRTKQLFIEDHVRWIAFQALTAVADLHRNGIMHRDIKPANLLIDANANVKLCDYGLARHVPQEPDRTLSPIMGSVTRRLQDQAPVISQHVATRWYRAPEIILLERKYSFGVDVWSIGCLLADLFRMMSARGGDQDQVPPLFPGASCFPMSPVKFGTRKGTGVDQASDQLRVILDVLGAPTALDIENGFESPDAQAYLKRLVELHAPSERNFRTLEERFPRTSPEGLDVLRQCLAWNPHCRPTAEQILAMPYFAQCPTNTHRTTTTTTTTQAVELSAPNSPMSPLADRLSRLDTSSPRPVELDVVNGALPDDSELSVCKLRILIAAELAHFTPHSPMPIVSEPNIVMFTPPKPKSSRKRVRKATVFDFNGDEEVVLSPTKRTKTTPSSLRLQQHTATQGKQDNRVVARLFH